MKEAELTIRNPTGLHARPAKVFVKLAKTFKSDIQVQHKSKTANAKSIISMLTLGAETGSQILISVDGEDEEEALFSLVEAVNSGLGESEQIESPAESPVSSAAAVSEKVALQTIEQASGITGLPAAPGVAIGPAFVLQRPEIIVEDEFSDVPTERGKLQAALSAAQEQLAAIREEMERKTSASEAAIFEVHQELLNDPDLLAAVESSIQNQVSAGRAWQSAIQARAAAMAQVGDALLAERATDLRDAGDRVLGLLLGQHAAGIHLPEHPVIVLAEDLTPSETAALDTSKVLGFGTAAGGPTAHTAIIARALGLPAVVSAGQPVLEIAPETTLILDGNRGEISVNPDAVAVSRAKREQEEWVAASRIAAQSAAEPAVTQDGHRVEVVANIGGVEDARSAAANGAEGVGLLRTEFLYLERTESPGESEQYAIYKDILLALKQQPVIARTLDIGGDKPLPYIDVPQEANPFLGERGIRLTLRRPEIMRQQLRALLRAVRHGNLRIMFPMVSQLNEWRRARDLVDEIRAELDAPAVELGIMIEVPSAALMADQFAPEVDFFSVGTNDLAQYTLAMDRMHPVMSAQSDGLHPAVLRLIAGTVEAAHAHGKWVGVCGALGGDPQAIPILVGLGVDELSVSVPALAMTKANIRALKFSEAQELARRALDCESAAQVRLLK